MQKTNFLEEDLPRKHVAAPLLYVRQANQLKIYLLIRNRKHRKNNYLI